MTKYNLFIAYCNWIVNFWVSIYRYLLDTMNSLYNRAIHRITVVNLSVRCAIRVYLKTLIIRCKNVLLCRRSNTRPPLVKQYVPHDVPLKPRYVFANGEIVNKPIYYDYSAIKLNQKQQPS